MTLLEECLHMEGEPYDPVIGLGYGFSRDQMLLNYRRILQSDCLPLKVAMGGLLSAQHKDLEACRIAAF
jgi:hypothetical protein